MDDLQRVVEQAVIDAHAFHGLLHGQDVARFHHRLHAPPLCGSEWLRQNLLFVLERG